MGPMDKVAQNLVFGGNNVAYNETHMLDQYLNQKNITNKTILEVLLA